MIPIIIAILVFCKALHSEKNLTEPRTMPNLICSYLFVNVISFIQYTRRI